MQLQRSYQTALLRALQIAGVPVTFETLDDTLRGEIIVDDITHLVPPVPVAVRGSRFNGTPAAGDRGVATYAAPPGGAVVEAFGDSITNDFALTAWGADDIPAITDGSGTMIELQNFNPSVGPGFRGLFAAGGSSVGTMVGGPQINANTSVFAPFLLEAGRIFAITNIIADDACEMFIIVREFPDPSVT